MIGTIGPVWDGNEVWLLTAGGATFAAFPLWYASLFSGFYLALLLILVGLIVRGVSFEFRGKVAAQRWKRAGTRPSSGAPRCPPCCGGSRSPTSSAGVPLNQAHVYTGNLLTLLNPYGLLGGLATLTLFALHGAIFLSLRTTGDLRERARKTALRIAVATVPVAAGFLVASQVAHGRLATDLTAAAAAVALLAAVAAIARGKEGWAFAGTAITLLLAVATLFGDLWPNVLPSTTAAAYSLTVHNASSSHYTLTVMTWVALIFTPVVLAYQAWTYWVFRHRVGGTPVTSPLEALSHGKPPGAGRGR